MLDILTIHSRTNLQGSPAAAIISTTSFACSRPVQVLSEIRGAKNGEQERKAMITVK